MAGAPPLNECIFLVSDAPLSSEGIFLSDATPSNKRSRRRFLLHATTTTTPTTPTSLPPPPLSHSSLRPIPILLLTASPPPSYVDCIVVCRCVRCGDGRVENGRTRPQRYGGDRRGRRRLNDVVVVVAVEIGLKIVLENIIDDDERIKKKRTRRRSIPRAGGSSTPSRSWFDGDDAKRGWFAEGGSGGRMMARSINFLGGKSAFVMIF